MSIHEIREDKHIDWFFKSAEKGNLVLKKRIKLYKSEAIKFAKDGLTVSPIDEVNKNTENFYDIRWDKSFPKGIPKDVKKYITNRTNLYPKNINLGQMLYIIAMRKRIKNKIMQTFSYLR